ncbi:hypothetical protein GWI33_017025 [Rhynchophorus ferrugineus]|uniref:Uncharacterized protein n=1 Tax=Rhynchophorus ferrugineus TaxID=354439 RepID=A0A834HWQ5_RHYFE|nr:hypothetical protein GWI33_017025 [Rhynchophorus ferrugineus]
MGINLDASESENDESDEGKSNKPKSDIYVPPKLSAVHYTGSETAQEKAKRLQEKSKKHALSASIIQDLREEYLDTPVEISQGNRAQQILSKEQKERQEYEEEYFTRLPITKTEKHRKRQLTTLGTLGDEITDFRSIQSGSKKRKAKVFKSKGKNMKRKRFH